MDGRSYGVLSCVIYGIAETTAFSGTNNLTMRMLFKAFSLIAGLGYQLLMHCFLFHIFSGWQTIQHP